jgi:succinyl-diaminopimelate desuccinylase
VSFLRAGVPAVEFGPAGGGHHGPEEWVSIPSLGRYRQALTDFVLQLPARLEELSETAPTQLRAVEGGLA